MADGQPHLSKIEDQGTKDLYMFVWSSSMSLVSDMFGNNQKYVFPPAAMDPSAVK